MKNVVIDYNKTPSLLKYAWVWMQCWYVCKVGQSLSDHIAARLGFFTLQSYIIHACMSLTTYGRSFTNRDPYYMSLTAHFISSDMGVDSTIS